MFINSLLFLIVNLVLFKLFFINVYIENLNVNINDI